MKARAAHALITNLYNVHEQPQGWQAWLSDLADFVGAQQAELENSRANALETRTGNKSMEGISATTDTTVVLNDQTRLRLVTSAARAIDHSRLQMLLPHLRRALAIEQEAGMPEVPQEQVAEHVLALLGLGVIVLQDNALVYTNPFARELLDSSGVFNCRGVQLSCADGENSKRLAGSLRDLSQRAATLCVLRGDVSGGPGAADIQVLCQVLPRGEGRIVLYLSRQTDHGGLLPLQIAHLSTRYGLTEKETRLVVGLAAGGTLASLAGEYHVSVHTLRTQLKSVFRKTGTHRQSALISLILHDVPQLYRSLPV